MKISRSKAWSSRTRTTMAVTSFCFLVSNASGAQADFEQPPKHDKTYESRYVVHEGPLSQGEHWVRLKGLQVHYSVVGSGPVLFIQSPSWGIGPTYLLNGLAPLASSLTLVAYDVPGSGSSEKPGDGYQLTSPEIADYVDELRQHLRLQTFDLLGHSQGSALAISYAAQYPSRVRRLVLVGSQLYGYSGSQEAEKLDGVRRNDPRFEEAIKERAAPSPANDLDYTAHFVKLSPYYLFDPQNAQAFIATLTKPLSAWPSQAKRRPAPAIEQVNSLPLITADTLVIDGQEDPVCPPMVSRRIAEGIKESRLVIYERTGHFPWIEQPSRFFDDVKRHLTNAR